MKVSIGRKNGSYFYGEIVGDQGEVLHSVEAPTEKSVESMLRTILYLTME